MGKPEAIVVGGGISGLMTAISLARRGVKVDLIDRWEPGHARATSSDYNRVIRSIHGRDKFYTRWAREARLGWLELEEETGIDHSDLEVIDDFLFESQYPVSGRRYGGGDIVMKTLRIFLGRLLNDQPIEVTEHDGFRWVDWSPPHSIQEQTIDPVLETLAKYLGTDDR